MSITMSDRAVKRVNAFLTSRGKKHKTLRLGVRTSGCSGMSYVLEVIDKPTAEDIIFEVKGIKIIIDSKSLKFLDGMQLDFVKNGLNESFEFINPNAKSVCGCGKSFNI